MLNNLQLTSQYIVWQLGLELETQLIENKRIMSDRCLSRYGKSMSSDHLADMGEMALTDKGNDVLAVTWCFSEFRDPYVLIFVDCPLSLYVYLKIKQQCFWRN